MAILTRDQILAGAGLRKTETVDVPELGGQVIVRELSGEERDRIEVGSWKGKGKNATPDLRNVRARLVAATVVDEKGKKLFTPQDVEQLGRISAIALNRIFEVSRRLAGMSEEDVEELEADFGNAQNEDSTSD